jgi:hypothetical protein
MSDETIVNRKPKNYQTVQNDRTNANTVYLNNWTLYCSESIPVPYMLQQWRNERAIESEAYNFWNA